MSTAQINLRLRISLALSLFVHGLVVVFAFTLVISSPPQPASHVHVSLQVFEKAPPKKESRSSKARAPSVSRSNSSARINTIASPVLSPTVEHQTDNPPQVGGEGARPSRIVDALYTQRARRNGIEGTVALDITIGVDGRVKSARIKKGLGYGLDEACLEAILQSTYQIATDSFGKPREEQLVHKYRFQLLTP